MPATMLSDSVTVGYGYSVGLNQRQDVLHGVPTPFLLPVASIRLFDKIEVYATYIPRLPKSIGVAGDTAFIFTGVQF